MKNVVDLFIAKDRTALFWFMIACSSMLLSALYAISVISAVRTKPQYVIMDGAGIYYLAPSVEFAQATEMHLAQTRMAMETLYTRTPKTLPLGERLNKMFMKNAREMVKAELNKEANKFETQKIYQTVEVEQPTLGRIDPNGFIETRATAKLTRRGTFDGKEQTKQYTVKAAFGWILNTSMATNGGYPTVCSLVITGDPVELPE
jgi:hypothetical protein